MHLFWFASKDVTLPLFTPALQKSISIALNYNLHLNNGGDSLCTNSSIWRAKKGSASLIPCACPLLNAEGPGSTCKEGENLVSCEHTGIAAPATPEKS